jgi:hypothetical protein
VFFVVKRATMLVPSGPTDHLFILLTDPRGKEKEVLMACIRSVSPPLPFDASCVLDSGDHPFVKHKSWVDYSHLRIETAERIEKAVTSGLFKPKAICSTQVHAYICRGLEKSPHTAPKYATFLEKAHARGD